jgi:predicted dehydrogenase
MELVVRALVVGLGSMGRRRIRNLRMLGVVELAGVDTHLGRAREVEGLLCIKSFPDFETAVEHFQPDVVVVSTDPRHHMDVAFAAMAHDLPCFIEASVVDAERMRELDTLAQARGVVMAPSCTMRFFPGPLLVKELIQRGSIGRPLTLTYQTGQWLPDWHPWEEIEDYYVSTRETGGCREIVPFELTWLNDVFGMPEPLSCVRSKVSDLAADIDDVYSFVLRYPGGLIAAVTVEVISRPAACRELRVTGDSGVIVYSADENAVRYMCRESPEWMHIPLGVGTVEHGYINPEEPYVKELSLFLTAVERSEPETYPNSLAADYGVLQLLGALEALAVDA